MTVIIPAYNAAATVRQTLNSVLAQSYQQIEVIVVDDGSSDNTSAIVGEFVERDARFKLVAQSNAGVGAARNTAIGLASGKYIAPLDADDFWLPEKLEKQVVCMEQCDRETGFVYCWYRLVNRLGTFIGDCHPETFEGRLRQVILLRNVVGNGSVPLIRATALEKVGLYLTRAEQGGAQGCEDWDLYLRIAEEFGVRMVFDYLLAYRQNVSGMSGNAEKMAASFEVFLHRARKRNRDLSSSIFGWSAGSFYLYLARNCYHRGHYRWCLRYLKEAVRTDPALLLTTGIYRTALATFRNMIEDPQGDKMAQMFLRPPPQNEGKKVEMNSDKKKKRLFISNWIFENIERRRWSDALDDGA